MSYTTSDTKQETVVGTLQIIQRLGVGDKRISPAAKVQKTSPFEQVARKPGDLAGDDDPHLAKNDVRNQPAEPGTGAGLAGRAAEIVVHDLNVHLRPAQKAGAVRQTVLQPRRLAVALNLPRGGLADICEPYFYGNLSGLLPCFQGEATRSGSHIIIP